MRRQMSTIGPRVLDNYDFLRCIAKSKSERKRLKYIKNATRDQLLSLVEVAANILSPNFSITKRHKDRLIPHANYIRRLSRVRSERGARILTQRGNGPIFASLLIPIISEIGRLLLTRNNNNNNG